MEKMNVNWKEEFEKDQALESYRTRVMNNELTQKEKEELDEVKNFMSSFPISDYIKD